ncbi:hypothetical protein V8C42DRAFT_89956 [Trichoderma barbatum]
MVAVIEPRTRDFGVQTTCWDCDLSQYSPHSSRASLLAVLACAVAVQSKSYWLCSCSIWDAICLSRPCSQLRASTCFVRGGVSLFMKDGDSVSIPHNVLRLGQFPLLWFGRQHMVKTTLRLVDADSPGQCPTERMGTTWRSRPWDEKQRLV